MEKEFFLSNIQKILYNHLTTWTAIIKEYAINIFLILAAIYLVVRILMMLLEDAGAIDISKILGFITKFTFITGFFLFLLENGVKLASSIVNSFIQIGNRALGYSSTTQGTVDEILSAGYKFWEAVNHSGASPMNIPVYILTFLLGLIIFILIIIIVANYIVEVASAWILVYAGYFVLAFGSTEWTRETVISYFKAVVAIGLKILTLMLLISISIELLNHHIKYFEVHGYTVNNGITLLVAVIILVMIMNKVPDAVAALVSGAWGHMSAVNMASAMAAGMMAFQAAKTVGLAAKTGGLATVTAAKDFKQGATDAKSDFIANNQNNTFTPNNNSETSSFTTSNNTDNLKTNNSSNNNNTTDSNANNTDDINNQPLKNNDNKLFEDNDSNDEKQKTINGSGFFYRAGRGAGYLSGKYSHYKNNRSAGLNAKPVSDNTILSEIKDIQNKENKVDNNENNLDTNINK